MTAASIPGITGGAGVAREDLVLNTTEKEVFVQLQVRGHKVIPEIHRANHAVLMRGPTRGAHQAHRERWRRAKLHPISLPNSVIWVNADSSGVQRRGRLKKPAAPNVPPVQTTTQAKRRSCLRMRLRYPGLESRWEPYLWVL